MALIYEKELEINLNIIFNKLLEFFDDDEDKLSDWIDKKNPDLDGLSPNDMIDAGKVDDLLIFIYEMVGRNKDSEQRSS